MSFATAQPSADDGLRLRAPVEVMTPEAMSAFKASRLSFLRLVIRRMVAERWRIETRRFDLDEDGIGTAIYEIRNPGRTLYFVVLSDNLPEERRTDRIIENHYDGEAFLCLDAPTEQRIAYQRDQFRDFLLGRADRRTIGWTRVNRSGRIFNRMVDALAAGRQPDIDEVEAVGYLMRNNGFWGNGRHGTTVFPGYQPGEFLASPYHADLLTLFMWRHFSVDLVEHIARRRNQDAARLDPRIKQYLGIGNASGLGLVPFVLRHPARVDAWIRTRETAIARVKAMPLADGTPEVGQLVALLDRAIAYYRQGTQVRGGIFQSSAGLVADLERLCEESAARQGGPMTWVGLCDWAADSVGLEGLELLHSLMIELYPAIAEELAPQLLGYIEDSRDVRPERTVGDLCALLRQNYEWVRSIDAMSPEARRHFWYLSQDNLEPRHGLRGVDPGENYETYVDVVGDLQSLWDELERQPEDRSVAAFLFAQPWHRNIVERMQSTAYCTYGEVRANVLGDDFEPCHLIRFLLTQYGMEKLDPQSRLWVRGTFLQGAPTAEDVAAGREGDWIFPVKPNMASQE